MNDSLISMHMNIRILTPKLQLPHKTVTCIVLTQILNYLTQMS